MPGLVDTDQSNVDEIAAADIKCFLNNVPAEVVGISFLSGGQRGDPASARLNVMNKQFPNQLPWRVTFSFSSGLQYPALEIWNGDQKNKVKAQNALLHRARCKSGASIGLYIADMERSE